MFLFVLVSEGASLPIVEDPSENAQSSLTENVGRGRKWKRNEHNWKKNIRKCLQNSGKEFQSDNGWRYIPAKTFSMNFDSHCSRRCPEKFPKELS